MPVTIKRKPVPEPPGKTTSKRRTEEEPSGELGHVIVGPASELSACGLPSAGNPWKPWSTDGTFMAIDPGLGGTGWAVFTLEGFDKLECPVASGSVSCDRDDRPWWCRANMIADELRNISKAFACRAFYAELPQFMDTPGAGQAAARDGDLVKLTWLTGALAGALSDASGYTLAPVPINQWKQQLPKSVCDRRIRERLARFDWSPSTNTTHEMDAVGIGLFVKGHF